MAVDSQYASPSKPASTTPSISPTQRFIKSWVMQPGDIVLKTTPAKLSASIRKFTSTNISHAMLCLAGKQCHRLHR